MSVPKAIPHRVDVFLRFAVFSFGFVLPLGINDVHSL